jgi:hypothetical protein
VCHALLQDPKFFRLLLRIDEELSGEVRAGGCACGGVLHRAKYPRKPRGCPAEVRSEFEWRFSFCCNRCRGRATPMSVRFLARRVYLALAMVLVSSHHAAQTPAAGRLSMTLDVPVRTLQRWRNWWTRQLPLTTFWQAASAHFMPPVATEQFPASLLERFVGNAGDVLLRLLVFLTPLTVGAIALSEGC